MRLVGYVVFPGFGVMSFGAMSVFEAANARVGTSQYDLRLLSETGGPVRSSSGVVVQTEAFSEAVFDTTIIGGGGDMQFTPGLRRYLQKAARVSRRIAATCTGAFYLADAALLAGRRVTVHWFFAAAFRRDYPEVDLVDDQLFVVDGSIWTSAGMAAGIDQSLAMVAEDLGSEVARNVAKDLVLPFRRAGGLSQRSAMLEIEPKSSRVQEALAYARNHIGASITVGLMAQAANMSPRQFTRVFRQETGRSPAKAVERLRVEIARAQIQEGRHSIEVVARQTGFRDRERMRRAFVRVFGEPPQSIRRAAKANRRS
jgi:transcriptional regulator GlxA family with amidase domain